MRGRHFDVLMHMQLALRASLLSTLIPARIKLGFDRKPRARELQWLFTTHRIRPARNAARHGLAVRLRRERSTSTKSCCAGISRIPDAARDYARRLIPDGVQDAGRSAPARAIARATGVPSTTRRSPIMPIAALGLQGRAVRRTQRTGDSAWARPSSGRMQQPCTNTIGKDTLLELLATLERATILLTPDSGPAHMATAVGTPVIGLYAATNPPRSGPYLSRQWCVDKYDVAARTPARQAGLANCRGPPRSNGPGVMDLITPEDVAKKLNSVMAALARKGR